jgi:pimeloyl-ACP methyl ester carboxylesterase
MRMMLAAVLLVLSVLADTGCAAAPHPPGSYSATLHGKAVHYDDYATDKEGTPIVLVHGGWIDSRVWKYNIPGLSEKLRVIAVDLPGHGRSDIPTEYSMDVFAAAIAAAMDDAGVERAVLVGQSNGVPTVRQFYRNYPERTVGLVCTDGALREIIDSAMIESLITQLESEDFQEIVLARIGEVTRSSTLLTDAQVAQLEEVVLAQPQQTIVGDIVTRRDESIWATDPIDVPVLIINAKSPNWTDDYRAFVDELVTDRPYEYHEWDDVSHLLMMEKPKEFNEAILKFARMVDR